MSHYRITLFRLLGFAVRVDASWLLLALFITWSLARGYFPAVLPGQEPATYWWMGVAGALGLFVSIILHEFSHSLVARQLGVPITGITLFVFGGVAEMEDEPPSPRAEFLMAVAGPVASLMVAGGVYVAAGIAADGAAARAVGMAAGPDPGVTAAVLIYLSLINLVLAAFNLVPAFPLDGGRMLRAALWHWLGDLRRATRIAARVGRLFGFWLIAAGILSALTGNLLGGVWWFLIGLFVIQSATASYQHVLLRQVLEGQPLRRFMTVNPVAVPGSITLEELAQRYVHRLYYKFYPVLEDERPVGCVHTDQLKTVPREEWARRTVREVMQPLSAQNTIRADADAMQALALMTRSGQSRLVVLEGPRLVGLIALKDLLRFFQLKVDLEERGATRQRPLP